MATQKKGSVTSENSVNGGDNKKAKAVKYHNLVTSELLAKPDIKKSITKINEALFGLARNNIAIGQSLFDLNESFNKHLQNKKEKKKAFFSFVQTRFGLQERRVQEYITIAKNKALAALDIPISFQVELARLPQKNLKDVLNLFSEEKLKKMCFKEVQQIVRLHNPKKVEVKIDKKSSIKSQRPNLKEVPKSTTIDEEQIILAVKELPLEQATTTAVASLRASFDELKDILEKETTNQPILGLDGLLIEISNWITARQLIQKKGA